MLKCRLFFAGLRRWFSCSRHYRGFFFLSSEKEAKRTRGGLRVQPQRFGPLWTPPAPQIRCLAGSGATHDRLAGASRGALVLLFLGGGCPARPLLLLVGSRGIPSYFRVPVYVIGQCLLGLFCSLTSEVAYMGWRRFPKGDRKALWSRPQTRNPCSSSTRRGAPSVRRDPCKGSVRRGIPERECRGSKTLCRVVRAAP